MYRIVVEDNSGNQNSIDNPTKVVYEEALNGNSNFDIIIEDAGSIERSVLAKGNSVSIYRNGSLEITGEIDRRKLQSNGFLRIRGLGKVEKDLQVQAPDKRSSDWTSLDSNGIIGDLVGQQPSVSANIIDNVSVDSFRSHKNQTVLDRIAAFCKAADQDYSFDYANNEVDIENHKGSATSVRTLNEGRDITNIEVDEDDTEKVEKVTIIGKGQGDAQIRGSYDGGSFSQGDKEITKTNKTIDTTAEANTRAELWYNQLNSTRYKYTFNVIDIEMSFTLGDVITLNAPTVDADQVDRRIVSYKRVITNDLEKLSLEVRGTGERTSAKDRLNQLAAQRAFSADANTLDQLSGNTINVNESDVSDSSTGTTAQFYVSSELVEDSTGTNKVSKVLLDYQIGDYRKITGETTEKRLKTTNPTVNSDRIKSFNNTTFYSKVNNFGDVEEARTRTRSDNEGNVSSIQSDNDGGAGTIVEATGDTGSTRDSISGGNWGTVWNISSELVNTQAFYVVVFLKVWADGYPDSLSDVYSSISAVKLRNTSTSTDKMQYPLYVTHDTILNNIDFTAETTGEVFSGEIVTVPFYLPEDVYGDDFEVQLKAANDLEFFFYGYCAWIGEHDHQVDSAIDRANNIDVYVQKSDQSKFDASKNSDQKSNENKIPGPNDAEDTVSTYYTTIDADSASNEDTVTAAVLDLTEVTTSADGIKLYIDGTDRTLDVFGSSPHNSTNGEDIDITNYVSSAGRHTVTIYPNNSSGSADNAHVQLNVTAEHQKEN